MKKINIGILGCANIAQRFIIPALNEMEEFNIIGIASRSKEKANKFSKEFNINPFYSYDLLLEVENIDAIYIPLPNSMHYEWVKKALNKNLHVLVEKSMACSYDEVLKLNKLAEMKNLVLIENFQFRFHSQLQYIKDLVDSGKIGELRNIRSSFGFPPFSDDDNIRYKKELGGGALLDAGAYTIKISQIFLGNDIYVDSATLKYSDDKKVDIWGSGCLKSTNSAINSQIAFGFDNFYQCSIELWGSKGKIKTDRIFTSPPGYSPIIELETQKGKEVKVLKEDNHFKNMILFFYNQIMKNNKEEYLNNICQAKLINEFVVKSKESL